MNSETNMEIWDVVVIGGGPAGMMAAGRAAQQGKTTLLLEKNTDLGKKLLITGGGRCNVTNNKLEMASLVASYKGAPKALFSVFSQFNVQDTLDFFHNLGMETKEENEGRIFPVSDSAQSVWQALLDFMKSYKVMIQTNATVTGINKNEEIMKISTSRGEYFCKSCVLATGGSSRPETGSNGDGLRWLVKLGHTIIDNSFALVPIALKDPWVKQLAGVSLKDIKLSIWQEGKKQDSRTGKMLFTHFGITGPAVLNTSSKVGELLQYGEVFLELDLQPELDQGALKEELHNLLTSESNKKIKNSLNKLVPSALVKVILSLSETDPEKENHSITREERSRILRLIKGFPLSVKNLLGADKAVVSSGGVSIDEVDFKTMQSRIISGLYLVGDVLNIDRPSGGYSLQLCWSTGFVAGNSIP